ncbi:MAG: phenylalanine--tRNA ligase subunit beta [Bacteroidales bacterium]|nr:phenylalanine--tRNA ligase subunit beta [Bacteroidales bacterium]
MKISYNWLQDYLHLDADAQETAGILTQIGLEVENIETIETIPGSLQGLVVGRVVSCSKHPNADKLNLTTVDIGGPELLSIVCGAPNVAANQKVVVAPAGTTLFGGEAPFTIKKAKIRGEISEGMICAEDEIGTGKEHAGIIVLPEESVPGTPVSELYEIETDTVFEIGLTPNRIDGASHIGAARDLHAALSLEQNISLEIPDVQNFKADNHYLEIGVEIKEPEGCLRYSGVTLTDITVGDSPDWLQNRLRSIGLTPINNIVDITNYVLHETGQPLHAFNADEIKGNTVIVKTLPEGTPFATLDEVTHKLSDQDLMICNREEGMCIAGVFGGYQSGITGSTTNVFLESACFNPVWIRRTSKRHLLNTDSSFRFERGTDPNGTIYALKRAALLICEIAGGKISSEIIDYYPKKIEPYPVFLQWNNLDRLIGVKIDHETVKQILQALDIQVIKEQSTGLQLAVPTYRVDVQREADVIEEILRIYGYNNIGYQQELHATLTHTPHPDPHYLENMIAEQLVGQGLHEMMANSLTKASYYEGNYASVPSGETVTLFNPLSSDLNAMRQTLLFGGLETVAFNLNHQNSNLQLFEFGNTYRLKPDSNPARAGSYHEERCLSLLLTGQPGPDHWKKNNAPYDLFSMKAIIELILKRLGIQQERLTWAAATNAWLINGTTVTLGKTPLLTYGEVAPKISEKFDITQPVYFAELKWDLLVSKSSGSVTYHEIPKYPVVRRDLALIVDQSVSFSEIRQLAFQVEKKLLKEISLFDLFESEKIGKGKKSMAITFILQDPRQTLKDKLIDKTMNNLIRAFEQKIGAVLRSG